MRIYIALKRISPVKKDATSCKLFLSILGDENYVNPFLTDSEASELFHLLERDGNELADI